jgi:hypothetical protein
VFFYGAGALQDLLVETVAGVPEDLAPIDAIAAAIEVAGGLLQERRTFAVERQAVISANPELQERELIKLATLALALADALRVRGVNERAARLAGEAGVAVFKIAFERWIEESGSDLPEIMREAMAELRAVADGR